MSMQNVFEYYTERVKDKTETNNNETLDRTNAAASAQWANHNTEINRHKVHLKCTFQIEKRNAVKWNGRDSCKIFNNGTEKKMEEKKKHRHKIIADRSANQCSVFSPKLNEWYQLFSSIFYDKIHFQVATDAAALFCFHFSISTMWCVDFNLNIFSFIVFISKRKWRGKKTRRRKRRNNSM